MKVLGVIPARYKSTRLPGKPLIKIDGISIIERVYKRAEKAKLLNRVLVATDDIRIYNEVENFGGNVIMTSSKHQSGTDRISEIANKTKYNVIVNIQGDEPFISPSNIDKIISPFFNDLNLNATTLAIRFKDIYEIMDINKVKVVFDRNNYALYFSRSIIPFNRNEALVKMNLETTKYFKHIGLYAYRRIFLNKFAKMKISELEKCEKLEQLRILENGWKIKVVLTNIDSYSIDTMQDLEKVKNYRS